jgi:hypothetical protein
MDNQLKAQRRQYIRLRASWPKQRPDRLRQPKNFHRKSYLLRSLTTMLSSSCMYVEHSSNTWFLSALGSMFGNVYRLSYCSSARPGGAPRRSCRMHSTPQNSGLHPKCNVILHR